MTLRYQLSGKRWQTVPVRVARGVKQGDAPSLVNFNILVDEHFQIQPKGCGDTFNSQTTKTVTFDDDLMLLDDSTVGLQHLIDHTRPFLRECGITLNNVKSHTVAFFGYREKIIVGASSRPKDDASSNSPGS